LELQANASRLTPPLEGIGFQYGFNTEYLKKVGQYWLDKYDWRAREKALNKYPHFKTTVNGLQIHFQHIKSKNNNKYRKTRPLLLLHGWPGSFIEFQKVIPDLIDPKDSDINFELIIPSLPGYGFSEAAHRPGLGPVEAAQLFKNLMVRLGHSKFYAQGGDWGALVTTMMASLYPENVKGLHLNMCSSMHPRSTAKLLLGQICPSYFFSEMEQKKLVPFSKFFNFINREMGYLHIQATKPDTVGVGLSNSPIGLAAYILEKFSTWTNPEGYSMNDGGLTSWNMDDLIDNLMVYWVTNSITSSMRFYSEALNLRERAYEMDKVPVLIPTGCFSSPNELVNNGPWIISDKFQNLVQFTEPAKGGHFAAFEVPDLISKDILKFFNHLESSGLAGFEKKPQEPKKEL